MLSQFYNKYLTPKQKNQLKRLYYKANLSITRSFFSYNEDQLRNYLIKLGLKNGDTILVHSSFDQFNGFKGNPQDIINCLIDILGENGNLLMVSMPYTCATSDYLKKSPVFNVRKTPSRMGIISEIFRRKKGVVRSLHPSHPVLAYGRDALQIVENHQKCIYPCGDNSPFAKFRALNGKVLFFNVPFSTFTFLHYLEDLIKDRLPFPVYTDELFKTRVIDYHGEEIKVETYAFGKTAVTARRPQILENHLVEEGLLIRKRIGRTKLLLVRAEDAVECTSKMLENKIIFYETGSPFVKI